MSALVIRTEIDQSLAVATRRGSKRRKVVKEMSDENVQVQDEQESQQASPATGGETKESQKTVFDLKTFDNVLLKKTYTVPKKPTSIQEVLATMNNDTSALLDLIHAGLIKQVQDATYNSDANDGWFLTDSENNITTTLYTGSYADKNKKAMIDAAVLTLAKLNGYDKSMSAEDKEAKKEAARKFLRENPAMLGGLQS